MLYLAEGLGRCPADPDLFRLVAAAAIRAGEARTAARWPASEWRPAVAGGRPSPQRGLGGGGLCVDGVRASGEAEFWGASHPVDCSPVPAAACTARCLPAPRPAPCLGDAIAASRCRLAALLRRCAVAMLHNYARKQIPELIPQLIMADA